MSLLDVRIDPAPVGSAAGMILLGILVLIFTVIAIGAFVFLLKFLKRRKDRTVVINSDSGPHRSSPNQ
jgi:hypothetical protein